MALKIDKQNIINLFKQKKFNKISKISRKMRDYFKDQQDISKIIIMSDFNTKNFVEAELFLKSIISKNNNSEFNYILGNVLKAQDKNYEAIIAFKESILLNRNYSEAYNNLANVQKKIGDFDQALLNYKNAIKVKKDNLEAYYNLASLLKSLKKYEEAIKYYKQAVQLNPNFAEAYNDIGTIFSILGKFIDAQKCFLKSIKINNYFSEPYKNYVQSCTINEKDEIFKNLKAIVKKNDLNDEQKEVFFYSISKAYFDTKNDDLAFKYLNQANKLKLSRFHYSFKKEKKEFKKIKEIFLNKNFFNLKNNKKSKTIPIFILGMPRSGTSLVEQIVSNHSEVYGAGELDLLPISVENSDWQNSINFDEVVQKIRNEYLEKISLLTNKNYITDKLPGNFKRIGFIVNAFPECKIIHLQRNPMAICWSNYKSNFNSNGMAFTLNQEFTAEFYLLYRDLINFWKEKYSNKIINIKYEDLVENFEEEVKKLFLNLNLNWEKHLYDFHKNERPVETASFRQVRNKIYKNSSEQWKSYKKYLTPMIDILSKNNVEF